MCAESAAFTISGTKSVGVWVLVKMWSLHYIQMVDCVGCNLKVVQPDKWCKYNKFNAELPGLVIAQLRCYSGPAFDSLTHFTISTSLLIFRTFGAKKSG